MAVNCDDHAVNRRVKGGDNMESNSTSAAVNASAGDEVEVCSGYVHEDGVCVSWFQGFGNFAENLV